MKKNISYISHDAQVILNERKLTIRTNNEIIQSNTDDDVLKYATDILTKETFNITNYFTRIGVAIILAFTVENTNHPLPKLSPFLGCLTLISIYLYQKFMQGTQNSAYEPLSGEPIDIPEVVNEEDPHHCLELKPHPILKDSHIGVFNKSNQWLPPGTFFPYYGIIEILSLDDYNSQLSTNNKNLNSAIKVFQFNKNGQTYLTISKPEITEDFSSVSLLYFCNSSFTENELKKNDNVRDIGKANAMFTQIYTDEGIKGGILITDVVPPGGEILVPGNFKY